MNFRNLTHNLALSGSLLVACACSGSSGGAAAPNQTVTQSPAPTPTTNPQPASAGVSELQLASITGSGRQIVPVTLRQVSGKAAASAQFDVSFDSSLSLVEVQLGSAATAANKALQTRVLANGMTRVMIIAFDNANTIADGELARLVFDVPTSSGTRAVRLQSVETGSNLAEALKTTALAGQITTP